MHYSCSIEQDGCSMVARNIPLFQAIYALTIILDPVRLNEGDGIEETLRMKQAKYHQSCRISLNNTKLIRAQKRVSSTAPTDGRSKLREEAALKIECMFASYAKKEDPASKMRQAMTRQIIVCLNECA